MYSSKSDFGLEKSFLFLLDLIPIKTQQIIHDLNCDFELNRREAEQPCPCYVDDVQYNGIYDKKLSKGIKVR
jgi:hypothetical protein